MRTPTPWLIGLALTVASAAARAEEPTKTYPECNRVPTESEVNAAKGAYQAGTASFEEADYARAIDYWEDAYRRDCTADALLLNLARAYELYGRKRQAVVALETYLQREPNTPQKDQISRRIEVLKKQIEEAPTAAPAEPASPQPTTQPQPAPTGDPAPAANETTDTTPGKRSIVPLIVAGGGAAVSLIGLAIYLPASSTVSDFEKRCEDPDTRTGCPTDGLEDANAATGRMDLGTGLMIGGAVVAVGGVVWYFVSPRKPVAAELRDKPRIARVTPALGPNFAGLALDGTF